MPRPKLTKRQEEVIRQLCSAHGRRLVLGKGGYYRIVEADGSATFTRGVAGIVVDSLRKAGMIETSRLGASAFDGYGYAATAEAWALFGPGSRR